MRKYLCALCCRETNKNHFSYHSLHHVHSSFSHCRNFSKNIDSIDDTLFKFSKDDINSKEDPSSTNTSTNEMKTQLLILIKRKNYTDWIFIYFFYFTIFIEYITYIIKSIYIYVINITFTQMEKHKQDAKSHARCKGL